MSSVYNYINKENIQDVDNYSNNDIIIYKFDNVKFRTEISTYFNFSTPIGIHCNKIISITNRQLSYFIHKYNHYLGDEYMNNLRNTYINLNNCTEKTIVIEEPVFLFIDYDAINGTGHSYDIMFYYLYHYYKNNLSCKLLVVNTNNVYYNNTLSLISKYFNIQYEYIDINKNYLFKHFQCVRNYQNI